MKVLLLSCLIALWGTGCAARHSTYMARASGDAQWLADRISTKEAVGGRYSVSMCTITGTNVTVTEDRVIFVPK